MTGTAAASVSLSGGSSPPVRLPGGGGLCPVSYPYDADASVKLVYPPAYPASAPAKGRVTRCFASVRVARAAGYTVAPPPAGDTRLGGLYMAPVPAGVSRTCQAAQRVAHAVIYCPSRLPAGWKAGVMNPDCPAAGCDAPLLSVSGSFPAPAAYIGMNPGVGDATIWAGSARQLRNYPVPVGCGFAAHPTPMGHGSFRGHPAAWHECSIFGNSTSSVLEWQIGRESYGITADGPAGIRRRLVEYIAAHLIQVNICDPGS